jgi:hypothetical protein
VAGQRAQKVRGRWWVAVEALHKFLGPLVLDSRAFERAVLVGEYHHAARMGSAAEGVVQDRGSERAVDPIQRHPGLVEQDPVEAAEAVVRPIVERLAHGLTQAGMLGDGCPWGRGQRHLEQLRMTGHFVGVAGEP